MQYLFYFKHGSEFLQEGGNQNYVTDTLYNLKTTGHNHHEPSNSGNNCHPKKQDNMIVPLILKHPSYLNFQSLSSNIKYSKWCTIKDYCMISLNPSTQTFYDPLKSTASLYSPGPHYQYRSSLHTVNTIEVPRQINC